MRRKFLLRSLRRAARVALLLLGAWAWCGPASAGHRVTLSSGSHLDAVAYRLEKDLLVVSLPGGGEIGFPPRNVVRIEECALPSVESEPGMKPPAPASSAPVPGAGGSGPIVSVWDPEPGVRALIREIAAEQAVDPRLVEAMVQVESNFNPYAVSRKGAMGLMQLMPETARRFRVGDAFDPSQNLEGGTRCIKELLERYGEVRLALAAYNAGEEAVNRYGGVPPYRETRAYVYRILQLLNP